MKKSLACLVALLALALPAAAAAAPVLTATPDPLLAPTTTVGHASGQFTVELRNDGAENVLVQNFSVGGADAAEFGVQGYTCATIQPGEKCEFSLWFAPKSAGAKQASLNLDLYEHGTQGIVLQGQAVPAQLTWSPRGTSACSRSTAAKVAPSSCRTPARPRSPSKTCGSPDPTMATSGSASRAARS